MKQAKQKKEKKISISETDYQRLLIYKLLKQQYIIYLHNMKQDFNRVYGYNYPKKNDTRGWEKYGAIKALTFLTMRFPK
jgi:hypothetical protein